ncbi:hypothetical protein EJB05_35316, partial [Eragrostis curvula]
CRSAHLAKHRQAAETSTAHLQIIHHKALAGERERAREKKNKTPLRSSRIKASPVGLVLGYKSRRDDEGPKSSVRSFDTNQDGKSTLFLHSGHVIRIKSEY